MENLIQLDSFTATIMGILLSDRTTNRNIIWATNSYQDEGYGEKDEISLEALEKINLQPRVFKALEAQKARTKKKAEVFTPSWLCNYMNNVCDEQWFDRKDVFNVQAEDRTWLAKRGRIKFEKERGKTWQDYVLSRRIEAACGEAPFLVSRYDTTTGEIIRISKRIGMLDRKLRVVNENTSSEEEWFEWVIKAYQSTYGYEFQGDNLLIARINFALTFVEYMESRWKKKPSSKQMEIIAKIISWNLWQMDGLSCEVPFGGASDNSPIQISLEGIEEAVPDKKEKIYANIKNWRNGNSNITIRFKDIGKEKKK